MRGQIVAGFHGPGYKANGGQISVPILGAWPVDQWTFRFSIKTSVAFNSLSTGVEQFSVGSGAGQRLYFRRWATDEFRCVFQDEAGVGGSASLYPISDSDWPADTWVHVAVTWSLDNRLRIYWDDGGTAKTTAAGTSSVLAPVLRPWGAAGRRDVLDAIRLTEANTTVSDMALYRYARVPNSATVLRKALPKITVDADTLGAGWRDTLTGVVDHGSDFSRSGSNSARDLSQIQAAADNGCKVVRLTEFNERAIPTVSSAGIGSITSIDWTDYDAYVNAYKDRGYRAAPAGIGYVPLALGGGANGTAVPNVSGLTEAQARVLCAKYFAMVVEHTENDLEMPVDYWSFGNEPHSATFWAGTSTQFKDLWVETYNQIRLLIPGFDKLGGSDGGNTTYQNIIIDAAEANALPLAAIFEHDYSARMATMLRTVDVVKAYAALHGFADTTVVISEWSNPLADLNDNGATPVTDGAIHLRPMAGAWLHHAIRHMYDYGIVAGSYFRLAQEATSHTSNVEMGFGLLQDDNAPTPAWAALSMLWQHAGNRLTATSNWPTYDVLASRDDDQLVLTYSSVRFDRQHERDSEHFRIDWQDLPEAFTWEHYQMDVGRPFGRPVLVGGGSEADLPSDVTIGGVGVGMFKLTF